MGKGGDASAVAAQRSVKLAGEKSEKFTWAEVKKHVSFLQLWRFICIGAVCRNLLAFALLFIQCLTR